MSAPGDRPTFPGSVTNASPIGTTMMTKLEKALKREIDIDGQAYVLTISPQGLLLTIKGKRKGRELTWKDLISGDAALAVALNASVQDGGEAGMGGGI